MSSKLFKKSCSHSKEKYHDDEYEEIIENDGIITISQGVRRICSICGDLILNSDDWIDHFRNGDEKHKEEYKKVSRFLHVSEDVTDKELLSFLIEKYLK